MPFSVANNYRRAVVREFSPHLRGRVIEVGCGVGQMTELLRQLPDIKYLLAVEPEAAFCRKFRELFPAQPLIEGKIESLRNAAAWNAIVSINVLEHIREDEWELAIYGELLRRERGRLCLFVPARQDNLRAHRQGFWTSPPLFPRATSREAAERRF